MTDSEPKDKGKDNESTKSDETTPPVAAPVKEPSIHDYRDVAEGVQARSRTDAEKAE